MARKPPAKWLAWSIVVRRGAARCSVGWTRKPTLHSLTEALQGKFRYSSTR